MKASLSWNRVAICLSAAAVLVLVAAVTPGAQASGGFKSCADKTIAFSVDNPEGGKQAIKIPVKKISVKGDSCAKAYEFLTLYFSGEKISSTNYPQKYVCKPAEFAAPVGYLPQICTKPGKTIKYATRGG